MPKKVWGEITYPFPNFIKAIAQLNLVYWSPRDDMFGGRALIESPSRKISLASIAYLIAGQQFFSCRQFRDDIWSKRNQEIPNQVNDWYTLRLITLKDTWLRERREKSLHLNSLFVGRAVLKYIRVISNLFKRYHTFHNIFHEIPNHKI